MTMASAIDKVNRKQKELLQLMVRERFGNDMEGLTVAVMGLAFRAGTGIGLIFAVFGLVLVAYYGLPRIMARASGADEQPMPPWLGAWGIDTASGYLTGRAAFAQVMTVPLLMLAWAIFIAFLR